MLSIELVKYKVFETRTRTQLTKIFPDFLYDLVVFINSIVKARFIANLNIQILEIFVLEFRTNGFGNLCNTQF
jgi:hypothetical protein